MNLVSRGCEAERYCVRPDLRLFHPYYFLFTHYFYSSALKTECMQTLSLFFYAWCRKGRQDITRECRMMVVLGRHIGGHEAVIRGGLGYCGRRGITTTTTTTTTTYLSFFLTLFFFFVLSLSSFFIHTLPHVMNEMNKHYSVIHSRSLHGNIHQTEAR